MIIIMITHQLHMTKHHDMWEQIKFSVAKLIDSV